MNSHFFALEVILEQSIKKNKTQKLCASAFYYFVEITGLEPVTSTLPVLRSSQMS